jgi:SNF2 family DNA or RNA helicase
MTMTDKFQYNDTIRAINQNRLLAFWATGTGKSYLLSAILAHLRFYGEIHKAIIFTSSIGVLNLPHELKKFVKNWDNDRVLVIGSITDLKKDQRLVFSQPHDWDVIICTYDTFRAINDAYYESEYGKKPTKNTLRKCSIPLKEWFGNYKGIAFFDECHLMGTPESSKWKNLQLALPNFHYRYLFSATPVDKKENMYPILKTLDNSLVDGLPYKDWLASFCSIGTAYSAWAPDLSTWDDIKWAKLQDRLYKDYAVRRDKDLLNLPDAIDMDLIYVEMTKKHREIYQMFTLESISRMKEMSVKSGTSVVSNLSNCMQYAQLSIDNPLCLEQTFANSDKQFNPDLIQKVSKFDYKKDFAKLKVLDSIIQNECVDLGNKVIVFYLHPATMEQLKLHFGDDAHYLTSDIEMSNRFNIVEDFKKSKNKILVASILISNSSFTLTECSAAIFYERCWDFKTYEQARGRIHRLGQDKEVRYYNMVYSNSIDNLQVLNKKDQVMKSLVRKSNLTDKEWKLLFGGSGVSQDECVEYLEKLI